MASKFELNLFKVEYHTTNNTVPAVAPVAVAPAAPAVAPHAPTSSPGRWKVWVKWGAKIVYFIFKLIFMFHGTDEDTLNLVVQVLPFLAPVASWVRKNLEN